jgi:hypothetical protein
MALTEASLGTSSSYGWFFIFPMKFIFSYENRNLLKNSFSKLTLISRTISASGTRAISSLSLFLLQLTLIGHSSEHWRFFYHSMQHIDQKKNIQMRKQGGGGVSPYLVAVERRFKITGMLKTISLRSTLVTS